MENKINLEKFERKIYSQNGEDGITMKRLSEDITETNSFEDSASNSRLLVGLVLKSDFLVFISDF